MSESRREWLIKLRTGRGWSQARLSEQLRVDVTTVGRWERGAQEIRLGNLEALARVFQLSLRQLTDLAGDSIDGQILGAAPPTVGRDRPTSRAPDQDGLDPVASLRSVIDGSRGLDHSVGPAGTLEIVRSHLTVADRLSESTRSPQDRSQLLGLTAQIHQFVGWMSFDTRDLASARASFEQARALATEADDAALLAYVLGPSAAFAEADAGDPRRGLDFAYAAQGWAARCGNQRLTAFVLTIGARVHAKLGDELLARQALDDAEAALANHDGWDTDPLWLRVFDETALLGHRGSCDLDLGRPAEAVALLDRQDSNAAEIFVRNRAIWRLDRAAAFRDLNEVDQACTETAQAMSLIDLTSSPRTRYKLRQLADSLATSPSRATQQLIEQLNRSDLVATTGGDDPATEAGESTGR